MTRKSETFTTKNIGLRGIYVADTRISVIDGDHGRLFYRGYAVEDLARDATFEEVVHLLLVGCLPTVDQIQEIRQALQAARVLPPATLALIKALPRTLGTMEALQVAMASLAAGDPDYDAERREGLVQAAIRATARLSTVLAAWYQVRQGREPVEPDTSLGVAGAFLHGLWGRVPTAEETHLMDAILVLHAEHAMNASTFTCRQIASTQAHLYAALTGAIGALSGPLHGGANARVMQMLYEIGSEDRVEEWVAGRIQAGKRIMGFGHAIYRTADPRAGILRRIAHDVLAQRPEGQWLKLAERVEEVSHQALRDKKGLVLYPNVDFFSGPLLVAIGLPMEMFPGAFAIARVAGWAAHYIEERLAEAQPKPELYRPESYYIGRFCGPSGCSFVPIEQRGAGCPCGKAFDGCDESMALKSA